VVPVADLAISKTDSADPILAGDPLTYTIMLTNSGPSAAAGVMLTDTLPTGVTFISASASQGSCSGTTIVVCNLGTLNSAGQASATIVIQTATSGTLNNMAEVASSTFDPNTANNVAVENTTVNPAADLSLALSDSPDPVVVGEPLTYTIIITNNGPSAAAGVTVTDVLPANTTFISATAGQGSCTGTNTVVCNLGMLASGASTTVTIVVVPTTPGVLNNSANVASATSDPAPGNNSATTTTTVLAPPFFMLYMPFVAKS
jgi:uncharacterized repeat protein (TIGR01451 family)